MTATYSSSYATKGVDPAVVVRIPPSSGVGTCADSRRPAGGGFRRGFYEVWLINADGKRMVSLGVLDPCTGGTFQVPAELTSQDYQIVDVSLEPRDGNPSTRTTASFAAPCRIERGTSVSG
ncbi:anti-sigma factor [Kribbella sp. NPDC049174]|uniref:anti-sigma factor n=1 Tax=Kribbella sp. NPDC049174 TaxID=3364112 RepID=UPI0037104D57